MRETSVAAAVVADMLQYLERHGVRPADAARECGLALPVAAGPDDRVSGRQLERLWALAVRETDDPRVALHMAAAYNPGALDILGYVVLSCATVGDVLDRLARYARLLNDGMRVDVVRESDVTTCHVTYLPTGDRYLARCPGHAIDALWAGLARELARVAVRPVAAREVWFRHAEPAGDGVEEYRRVFGPRLRFGAPDDRFVVATADLAAPVRSANPALLRAFEAHADAMLARMERAEGAGATSRRVARVLAERMTGALPTLREVARALAMSERNLQRALRGEGSSFQRLVDDVRRDLAISHLADPATSAGQVGFLLGFSEPSAFHRAFRRWTGQAPGAYRAGVGR